MREAASPTLKAKLLPEKLAFPEPANSTYSIVATMMRPEYGRGPLVSCTLVHAVTFDTNTHTFT